MAGMEHAIESCARNVLLILRFFCSYFAELFSGDTENRNPVPGTLCVTLTPTKKQVPLEEIQNNDDQRLSQTSVMTVDEDSSAALGNSGTTAGKSSQSPIPLTNLKNSCYMNSVVQSLAVFPKFILSLQKFLNAEAGPPAEASTSDSLKSRAAEPPTARFPIITSLVKLFLDYEMERRRSTDDSKIPDIRNRLQRLKETVGRLSKQFLTDNQQDAGEFFAYLMDAASDEIKKSGKENLIDQWFAATAETRIKCRTCGHVSDPIITNNTSTILAVPDCTDDSSEDYNVDLESLFARTLVQAERRELKCSCEGCEGTEADFVSTVSKLPQILMIQVSRISLAGEKIETPVGVSSILRVRTSVSASVRDQANATVGTRDQMVYYKLRSVICHIGQSITKGHYYSMTRNHVDDDWYDCDDHEIRQVDFLQVRQDSCVNGYCFFFQQGL